MKNKSFDCVEMKRKGAEKIRKRVRGMDHEQLVKYWIIRSAAFRAEHESRVPHDAGNIPEHPLQEQ